MEVKQTIIPGGQVQLLTDISQGELRRVLADPMVQKVSHLSINYVLDMFLGSKYYDITDEELKSPWAILNALAWDGQIIVVKR